MIISWRDLKGVCLLQERVKAEEERYLQIQDQPSFTLRRVAVDDIGTRIVWLLSPEAGILRALTGQQTLMRARKSTPRSGGMVASMC